jgi:hypothetical protein
MHPAVEALFKKALSHTKLKRLFVSKDELRTDPEDIESKDMCGWSRPHAWSIDEVLKQWDMSGSCGNTGQHSIRLDPNVLAQKEPEYKRAIVARANAEAARNEALLAEKQAIEMAVAKFKTTPEYQKLKSKLDYADSIWNFACEAMHDAKPGYLRGHWYTREEMRNALKEKSCPKKRSRNNRSSSASSSSKMTRK